MPPEPKYDFTPYEPDCTPGDTWETFDQDLLNHCSGERDDRGWSLADYLMAQDEGSAGGPALPLNNAANAADRKKALAAARKRAKNAYSMLLKHITDPDWQLDLKTNQCENADCILSFSVSDDSLFEGGLWGLGRERASALGRSPTL